MFENLVDKFLNHLKKIMIIEISKYDRSCELLQAKHKDLALHSGGTSCLDICVSASYAEDANND